MYFHRPVSDLAATLRLACRVVRMHRLVLLSPLQSVVFRECRVLSTTEFVNRMEWKAMYRQSLQMCTQPHSISFSILLTSGSMQLLWVLQTCQFDLRVAIMYTWLPEANQVLTRCSIMSVLCLTQANQVNRQSLSWGHILVSANKCSF